ncbi:MAG: hypothetical protein ACP5NG_02630 [Conexivisphaera sp.]
MASMIASRELRRKEYGHVKLKLLEIYRIVYSRGKDLEWLDRAYPALEELAGLLREGGDPDLLLGMLDEIKDELGS